MHTIRKLAFTILPVSLALFGASACSAADDRQGNDDDTETARGPIGKADATSGNCLDGNTSYCGGKSSGACWCDEACVSYGDCCADYTAACTSSTCPDPSDPDVHYVNNSYKNPLACANIYFACEAGQTPFSDDCGCGCIDEAAPSCPDPNDPSVHYVNDSAGKPEKCAVILFTCDSGQTPFSNDCGCGCIDDPAPSCPDPNDPSVHYVNNSAGNPAACTNIYFACEPGQTPFSTDCGCGCID